MQQEDAGCVSGSGCPLLASFRNMISDASWLLRIDAICSLFILGHVEQPSVQGLSCEYNVNGSPCSCSPAVPPHTGGIFTHPVQHSNANSTGQGPAGLILLLHLLWG